ncbi:acid-sensing ion channel 1-like [Anneissia japonica]|uniref:acid-sensing ion channel 1-like n=1 Tax=Anneissia japonica TaxID=1529436 RepID=UPI0014256367|nr:acid-sensing ion channel 1-like [Anneissia japonica]
MFKFDRVVSTFNGTANFFTKGLKYIRELFPDKGLTNLNPNNITHHLKDGLYPGGTDMRGFVSSNGHSIEDMIISCMFNGIECGPEHFQETLTNYGLCYKFKGMRPLNVTSPGPLNGLSLILDAEHLQYVAAPREKVGFRVSITDHEHVIDVTSEGLDVAVGMSTSIGIKRRHIISMPAPYSDCVPIMYDATTPADKHYTRSECLQTCETNYIMELCNCCVFFATNGSIPFCSAIQYKECYSGHKDTFSREKHKICNCPEPCEAVHFHKTLSFSNFPSLSVANTLYVTNRLDYFGKSLGWKIRQITFTNSKRKQEFIVAVTPSFLNATFRGFQLNENKLLKYLRKITLDVFTFVEKKITDNMFKVLYSKNSSMSINSEFYNDAEFYHDVKKRARTHVMCDSKAVQDEVMDMVSNTDFTNESGTDKYFNTFYDNLFDSIYGNVSVLSKEAALSIENIVGITELTTEYMRDTFARLDVFYDDMRTELQSDRCKYTISSLLGNLGGTLGLFFGASVLAFIEAMEFWFLNDSCRGKQRRNVHSV